MTQRTEQFAALAPQPADGLLALIALHRADPRDHKIDVGVGVYRDTAGATPVMRAVKAAEQRLLGEQATKSYLGAAGDLGFTALLGDIVFGTSGTSSDRLAGLQTPGGTGALRLGAALLARLGAGRPIWLGDPTWPNHAPIMIEAGLEPRRHPYFDASRGTIAFEAMLDALGAAAPGDILLLHGCCHNPTGTSLSLEQWRVIADLCNARGLIPFVDLAYQGLGDGVDADALGMRLLLAEVPEAMVAYSCDKNFGLYRDRVGALWVQAGTSAAAGLVCDNLHALARSLWSMPPDHGAAVVRIILDDPALTTDWRDELESMRRRLNSVRALLSTMHPRLVPVGWQRGLFSLLPLDPAAVTALREEHGIYMAQDGRVNIAGLTDQNLRRFAEAVAPFLQYREGANIHHHAIIAGKDYRS